MLLSLYVVLTTLILACTALPTDKPIPELIEQYNYNTYHETMIDFDEKYVVYFNSIEADHENTDYSFSDAEIQQHHDLFKRSTAASFVIVDTNPLNIGVQSMSWKPSLWNQYTAVPSDALPECQEVGGGYSVSLNSQKGRQLSGSSYYNVNVLNPQNLEVVTTILASSQLDQWGAGSLTLAGPVVAIFSVFAYDRNRVFCRAVLGLAPSTLATIMINNQGYAQPSAAFLNALGGSIIALAVGVVQNVVNRNYIQELKFNGINTNAYIAPLVPIAVCKSYTTRWCLPGLSVSVVTQVLHSVPYVTTNLMGFLFLDNLNAFILLPNAIVDEIYSQIPKAAKYPAQGSTISNLWAIPCHSSYLPSISLLFTGSSTVFTIRPTLSIVGAAWIGNGMCQGSIQYSNQIFGVLGAPFFASIYTVYYYNPAGTGISVSLAQAGTPPAT